jgi:hypothetical protein
MLMDAATACPQDSGREKPEDGEDAKVNITHEPVINIL